MLDRLGIGIRLADSLTTQRTIALVSIAVYTLLNAVGVKVVALIDNSAVGRAALGVGSLDRIPVQWLVLGVVTLVGLAYYAVRHRELPSPLLAPGRDDVTDDHRALARSA